MVTSIRDVRDMALELLRGGAGADAWLHPRRRLSTTERLFLELSFLSVLFEHRHTLVFDEVGDRLLFTLGHAASAPSDEDGERLLELLTRFNALFFIEEHPLSHRRAALISELLNQGGSAASLHVFSDDTRVFVDHGATALRLTLEDERPHLATRSHHKHIYEYGRVLVLRGREASEALFVRFNDAHALQSTCLSTAQLARELRMSAGLLLKKISRGKIETLFDGDASLREAVVFMLQRAQDARAHHPPEDSATRLLELVVSAPLVERDDVSRYCRDANISRGRLAALLEQAPVEGEAGSAR